MGHLKDIAIAAAGARRVMTTLREGIAWFNERGVLREELEALLDRDDTDISDVEYAALAGGAQDAIDELLAAGAAMQTDAVVEPIPAGVDPNVRTGDDGTLIAGGAPARVNPDEA